jgi:V8-like Glu-specific endopeptidase
MSTAPMIVIEHLAGARVGQRQELAASGRIRFGRHPDNEVAFDAHKDLDASARHAELRVEDGGWVLVDIGSSNGTSVDGQKISRHPVPEGVPMLVEFGSGGPRVRLYIGDPAQLAAVPATMVRSGRSSRPPPAGRRTMAMMVQHATAEAHAQRGIARHTMFMKSMVDQALHHSTRRFRILLVLVTTILLAAIVTLVVMVVRLSRQGAVAAPPPAAPDEAGPRIARESHNALYLLAVTEDDGTDTPFCTGFAVAPTWLATNAHCVDAINRMRGRGLSPFAVQNGNADPRARVELGRVVQHPGYRAGAPRQTVDVALVEVRATMPALVRLADRGRLEALDVGAAVYVYGFPGRLARASAPEATLTEGTVGRVTTLEERRGAFADNILVQHSAFAMEGTSGSPVFDVSGAVIAVNTGSYQRENDLREALSGYNVAIRSDTVQQLLGDHGGTGAGRGSP